MRHNFSVIRVVDNLIKRRRKLDNGCWEYTGNVNRGGYGKMKFRAKEISVHRFIAFICLGFDLNSPLKVLHKCDNPTCFNPLHLYIGTQLQNVNDTRARGRNFNLNLTHCPQGHPYTGENTYISPIDGGRMCRTCRKETKLRFRERQKIK